MIAPNCIKQLLAAEDPAGMGQQVVEQFEFGRPQFEQHAFQRHAVRRRIEPEAIQFQRLAAMLGRPSAQHRPNARYQFARAERLGYIIVSTKFKTGDAISAPATYR